MTSPMPPENAPATNDSVARAVDATAETAHGAIDRTASASSTLVDKAADAAKQAEKAAREQGRAALDVGEDVLRAGLGVVGAAADQAGKLFHALVDRGAKVEEKVVGQVKETVGTVREKVADVRGDVAARQQTLVTRVSDTVGGAVENTVSEPLAGAMRKVGVPTRAELRELAVAVATLSAKVDALVARLDAAGAPAPEDEAGIVTPDGLPAR
jgi:poly(hydroxyalkanoate) granule-associated protein